MSDAPTSEDRVNETTQGSGESETGPEARLLARAS